MYKRLFKNCLLLLVLLCCSHAVSAAKNKEKADKQHASAVNVEVAKVSTMDIPKLVTALGSLKALQKVTISSEVSGRVAKLFFKDGQQVAKGMPIIQLNNEQDKAAYEAAVTALKLSKVKYKRAKLLINVGGVSQQDLDQLKADVESKEADVKTALATLNQKELTAPFDGTLTAFQVQEGDYVNQGQPLVTLVNREQLEANYSIPENYLPKLKKGQQVYVKTSAYPDKHFNGTVTYIAPNVTEATRSVQVQAAINNKKGLLSPGMFVQVTQQIGMDKDALVVPDNAIEASVKGYTVFKVANGQAKQVIVKLGTHVGNKVQVIEGLQKGEKVVVAGQQKLQDGSNVKITKKDSAPTAKKTKKNKK